ncbi:MAG: sel1 repeat family protein [Magnetococcales bacterium]|nr:sel1 repeat family protein [Magnetococcales bacterium]
MTVKKTAIFPPFGGVGRENSVGKPALAFWAVVFMLLSSPVPGWSKPLQEANPEKDFHEATVALKSGYAGMAYNLFLRIAEKGNPRAQFLVGRMLEEGMGVAKEPMQAAQWYRKAAQQGHTEAQTRLGFLYLGGTTVPQDNAEALKWFQAAADQGGHPMAQAYLCSIHAEGVVVPANQKLSMEWCRKAAEQGIAAAQTMLGFHYALGKDPPPDRTAARQWFGQAAKQGYTVAIRALAEMDRGGDPTPVSLPPARAMSPTPYPVENTEPVGVPSPKRWE